MDLPNIQNSTKRGFDSPLSRTSPIRQNLNQTSRTPDVFNSQNLSKIRLGKSFLLYKELDRIEEEHDLRIGSQMDTYRDFENEKKKQQEVKFFAGFLEDIISCILIFDKRTGKLLSKAWGCYIKAANKGVKTRVEENTKKTTEKKNKNKNKGIQVEDVFVGHSEEYSKYMDMIRRALFKIDTMNHDKLVRELERLMVSLTPKDILYSSEEESNFEEEPKKKTEAKEPEEKKQVKLLNFKIEKKTPAKSSPLEKESQTYDLEESNLEVLNDIILERDKTIYELREKLARLHKNEESSSEKEPETVSRKLDMQGDWISITQNNRKSEINEKDLILNLQKNRIKTEKENEEIVKIKEQCKKYREELEIVQESMEISNFTIKKNEKTISELNENLQELEFKIVEMKKEKSEIELKLSEEVKARESIEKKIRDKAIKFDKANDKKNSVYKKSIILSKDLEKVDRGLHGDNLLGSGIDRMFNVNVATELAAEGYSNRPDKMTDKINEKMTDKINEKMTEKINEKLTDKNLDPLKYLERLTSTENFRSNFSSLTPERSIPGKTFLGITKSSLLKEQMSTISTAREGIMLRNSLINKNNMFKLLKISKEEFLGFSKQARLELFEALYEHKEKCGPDCEHLKKAYQIKEKERGRYYPLKKYNII